MHRYLICVAAALLAAVPAQAHEYPTSALADYVFGCMAANGQTSGGAGKVRVQHRRDRLDHPVRGIRGGRDRAAHAPVRGGGEKMALFTETAVAKGAVDRLRRAQIEAELRCF